MTRIVAADNHIIFRFVEDITSDRFNNSTDSGIIINSSDTKQSSISRWGHVVEVGPKVSDVKVGDYILIEEGKWTNGFYVDGKRHWKTDEKQIIATSDKPHTTY